jgi:hypothetical protein
MRNRQKIKVGRIVRMHADQMEEIGTYSSGLHRRLFGIDCASGDTFAAPGLSLTMTSMYVPEPVISLAIKPEGPQSEINMSKALNRFTKEDPTFKTFTNEETNETIISGMGELHLEVYLERMKREYQAEVHFRRPAGGLPRNHHPAGPISIIPTRNRPAAPASTAGWGLSWSPGAEAGLRFSTTRSRADRSRPSSSLHAKRDSSCMA